MSEIVIKIDKEGLRKAGIYFLFVALLISLMFALLVFDGCIGEKDIKIWEFDGKNMCFFGTIMEIAWLFMFALVSFVFIGNLAGIGDDD